MGHLRLQFAIWVCVATAILHLMSCSHSLSIGTLPQGADVSLLDADGNVANKLGETPLVMDSADLPADLRLVLSRPGFRDTFVIAPLLRGYTLDVQVALPRIEDEVQVDEFLKGSSRVANRMLRDLFQLQQLVLSEDAGNALAAADEMKKRYENLAVFHLLLGNAQLLNKQRDDAVKSYRSALDLDPEFNAPRIMLRRLGVTVPAASSTSDGRSVQRAEQGRAP